jgi:pimeloyl-ACP methyl ester carboxylesterase
LTERQLRPRSVSDVTKALGSIGNEVLLIAGADDPMAPPGAGQGMAAQIPCGRLIEIAGARHLSNVDSAAAFNAALLPFLLGGGQSCNDMLPRSRSLALATCRAASCKTELQGRS